MDASKADLSKILDPKTVLLRKRKVSAASDEIQIIAKKGPAVSATVGRSKEVVASANRELDKHKQWLEQHRSPYVQALDGCLRKIERRRLIRACGQAILTTARVLSSVCRTSLHTALRRLTDPRDLQWRVHEQLQKRIDAMDPLTAKAPLLSRMKIVRTAFQSGKRRIIFGS
jgi:hypothetical protein